jgi:hypothetical protein
VIIGKYRETNIPQKDALNQLLRKIYEQIGDFCILAVSLSKKTG